MKRFIFIMMIVIAAALAGFAIARQKYYYEPECFKIAKGNEAKIIEIAVNELSQRNFEPYYEVKHNYCPNVFRRKEATCVKFYFVDGSVGGQPTYCFKNNENIKFEFNFDGQ
jgi:hypothetical protein